MRTEVEHPRDRQAAAQIEVGASQCHQRGVVPTGGMAADEKSRRIPTERIGVFQHMGRHRHRASSKPVGKDMLRRQSVAYARET